MRLKKRKKVEAKFVLCSQLLKKQKGNKLPCCFIALHFINWDGVKEVCQSYRTHEVVYMCIFSHSKHHYHRHRPSQLRSIRDVILTITTSWNCHKRGHLIITLTLGLDLLNYKQLNQFLWLVPCSLNTEKES